MLVQGRPGAADERRTVRDGLALDPARQAPERRDDRESGPGLLFDNPLGPQEGAEAGSDGGDLDALGAARRFLRADIRRVSFILIAQGLGLSLEEIAAELARLPGERTPNAADWARISKALRERIDARIAALERTRANLDYCGGLRSLPFQFRMPSVVPTMSLSFVMPSNTSGMNGSCFSRTAHAIARKRMMRSSGS